MNVSECIGLLFLALIGLAWLILEVVLHRKLSQVETFTAAMDANNKNLKALPIVPTNHSLGTKTANLPVTDVHL